jgi:hypothetical protein
MVAASRAVLGSCNTNSKTCSATTVGRELLVSATAKRKEFD